jgi:DNA mismatch repair protein MutS2
MEKILKKLDLIDYIESFSKLMAREKSVILEGDINLHHKLISELSKFDFKAPSKVENLDSALMHIQKQGVLKIYEIFEFIKIINYFRYLKKFSFDGKMLEWLDKIIIPNEIIKISDYFDEKSNLKDGVAKLMRKIEKKQILKEKDIKRQMDRDIKSLR